MARENKKRPSATDHAVAGRRFEDIDTLVRLNTGESATLGQKLPDVQLSLPHRQTSGDRMKLGQKLPDVQLSLPNGQTSGDRMKLGP